MTFSVFLYEICAAERLQCTALSVVELQKIVCSDTGTEMYYTCGKCVVRKFNLKLATADLRGSDTDLL
jgi:hypothetical protein